jgi:hypothetical protein
MNETLGPAGLKIVEEDRDGDVEQTTNHRGCVPMGLREKREKMPRLKTTT